MPEPLTIYECPDGCGHQRIPDSGSTRQACQCSPPGGLVLMVPVRVFREEHVRPLWQSADGDHDRDLIHDAADAFPAPDDWKAA